MKLLIIGPQASGKGTQAELLSKKLGIPHISTGDLIRAEISTGTELGKEIERTVKQGKLISDEMSWQLAKQRLEEHPEGWILDGFPRTPAQAALLDAYAEIDHAVIVEISDEICIERISGRRICTLCGRDYHIKYKPPKQDGVCDDDQNTLEQREDDTPDAIRKRLAIYHEQTAPLMEHYAAKVLKVNGDQGIQEVFAEVSGKLGL